MKIINFTKFKICLVLALFCLVSSSKIKQNYDSTNGSLLIKGIFPKIVNAQLDVQKLFGGCINLIADDSKAENNKRQFWKNIIDSYKTKSAVKFSHLQTFLENSKIEITQSNKTMKCGDYIKTLMLPEKQIEEEKIQSGIRIELDKVFGTSIPSLPKSKDNIITHAISHRYKKSLTGPDTFKKLNGSSNK